MIVVRIELHSAATGVVTEIGRMLIGNVGGDFARRDYEVRVLRRKVRRLDTPNAVRQREWDSAKVTRIGEVKAFPSPAYNIWRLVARALASTFPEEAALRGPQEQGSQRPSQSG